MNQYIYNLVILFCVLVLGISCSKKSPQMNVVVLFTDDQRWNTIHALGNTEVITPNMDRLVASGVSFTRAHVLGSHHGAVCAPSRAMLLTGKPYMHIPRSYIDQGQVPSDSTFDFVTFPELLKSKGYETFFTGKWHNHTSKIAQSFNSGKNLFIGGMHQLKEGGHKKPKLWDFDPSGKYERKNRWQADQFSSSLYSDAAVDFIHNQTSNQPFCLYVAYTSPHDPREAPQEYQDLYDTSSLAIPVNFMPQHPFDNGHLRIRDENLAPFPRTEAIVKQELAGYYAMISEVDDQIGRVLDALEEKNMTENTIIVFAGDNGLAVGQHGLLGKQSVYDHSVRVPLIISVPGIEGNKRANTLCSLHDIYPTITDLLNLDTPNGVEGLSLAPSLLNHTHEIRDHLFLSHAKEMRAIRTHDDMKLIQYFVNGKKREQLFDLSNDPWELNNLKNSPDLQNIKQDLSKRLLNAMQSFDDAYLRLSILPTSDGIGQPVKIDMTSSLPNAELRYTIDKTPPSIESPLFESPLVFQKTTEIMAAMFVEGNQIGKTQSAIAFISEKISDLILDNLPSEKYPGFGAKTLVNGPNGTEQLKNGHWIGYEGDDLICTIQLKEASNINQVGIRYLNQPGNWIFPPQLIEIMSSKNGVDYQNNSTKKLEDSKIDAEIGPKESITEIKVDNIRFLKIKVKNIGTCPEWHPGNGQPAWLFIDEIFVH